jgi:hypothetical protein
MLLAKRVKKEFEFKDQFNNGEFSFFANLSFFLALSILGPRILQCGRATMLSGVT